MLKMLGKLMACWLTAFAIAGVTVWAGPEDEKSGPDVAAGDDRGGVAASAPPMPPNAAD